MQKNYFIYFVIGIVFLMIGTRGEAFVPQTPHLLHLVMHKIRVPDGMTITQTRKIAQAEAESENSTSESQALSLGETLTYLFPKSLRSDLGLKTGNQFYVMSGTAFVKILNGEVTDLNKSLGEYYTDPLLYRDYEILEKVLADSGIDVEQVSLQRLDGNICWFIGEPVFHRETGAEERGDPAGLWIGKDSFFPVRYLVRKSGRTVDIRYDNWRKVSRSWYPVETRIFIDGELFVEITVDKMELTPGLSTALFDVDKILSRYPRRGEGAGKTGHDAGMYSLDNELDTFNNLYD